MRHRVTLTFELDEEVTPSIFAGKVAQACSSGALRPGESVESPDGYIYTISEERMIDNPAFDFLKPKEDHA